MTMEAPLLTAFAATGGAVLIAVIGLIASVHYRLGKLEKAQEDLSANQEKGDAHTREMLTNEVANTREMLTKEIANTREMLTKEIANTHEMLTKEIANTHEMLTKEIANTREMAAQENANTREMAAQENAHTRELFSQLIMQETAAIRERSDAQHAETMGAIQRLTDAFLSHSHDADGTVRFRIPPPAALPSDE